VNSLLLLKTLVHLYSTLFVELELLMREREAKEKEPQIGEVFMLHCYFKFSSMEVTPSACLSIFLPKSKEKKRKEHNTMTLREKLMDLVNVALSLASN
jgi:hypothetical protein